MSLCLLLALKNVPSVIKARLHIARRQLNLTMLFTCLGLIVARAITQYLTLIMETLVKPVINKLKGKTMNGGTFNLKRISKLFITSLFVVLLAGCGTTATTPQTTGILGTAQNTVGDPVVGAIVCLISNTAISEIGLDIDDFSPTATDDEPLEDLSSNCTSGTYQTATTDSNGNYSFSTITEGTYFIYLKPADTDTGHLPGGSLCRTARYLSNTALDLDIEVSTVPSSSATYVGSTTCLSCHTNKETIKHTGHQLGLRNPGENGGNQDLSTFETATGITNFDSALDKFESDTTVYFYDYDSTRGFDKFKTSETSPGTTCTVGDSSDTTGVFFTVRLFKDGSTYKMTLTNACNSSDPNSPATYDVDFTYGGGVYKQRYFTLLTVGDSNNISGSSGYHILPLQYHQEGSDSYAPRTRKIWRDYNAYSGWYTFSTQLLRTPANSKSFDNNCAGCHLTGYTLTGNSTDGYMATAVADTNGHMWYGTKQEINTGCEVCHGPGSEHVAAGGSIVSPGFLTPEREVMICNRCHTRPKGVAGTDVPDDASGAFMLPGHTRSEFFSTYTNGQYDTNLGSDLLTDRDQHSNSHHQQGSDFVRSTHYKNRTHLLTCASCHDMHGTDYTRGLIASQDDNSICASCHSDKTSDLTGHTGDVLGVSTDMGARCVDCHMNKYAKTGSGRPGNGNTTGVSDGYWENDVTSHLFKVPLKSVSTASGTFLVLGVDQASVTMPIPFTDSCASCHDDDLSNN